MSETIAVIAPGAQTITVIAPCVGARSEVGALEAFARALGSLS